MIGQGAGPTKGLEHAAVTKRAGGGAKRWRRASVWWAERAWWPLFDDGS